jgi:hypothetical protein
MRGQIIRRSNYEPLSEPKAKSKEGSLQLNVHETGESKFAVSRTQVGDLAPLGLPITISREGWEGEESNSPCLISFEVTVMNRMPFSNKG